MTRFWVGGLRIFALVLVITAGLMALARRESVRGYWITFMAYEDRHTQIFRMWEDGRALQPITHLSAENPITIAEQIPSPDGRWIAFIANLHGPNLNLYLWSADDFSTQRITNDNYTVRQDLSWSGDAQWLYFSEKHPSIKNSIPSLLRLNPETGMIEDVSETWAFALQDSQNPTLSPDLQHIAYTSQVGIGDYDLFVADSTGTTLNLTNGAGFAYKPTWSNSGEWLTYLQRENDQTALYRTRPDGTEMQRLTPELYEHIDSLRWSPDDRWLITIVGGSTPQNPFAYTMELTKIDLQTGEGFLMTDSPHLGRVQAAWMPYYEKFRYTPWPFLLISGGLWGLSYAGRIVPRR